MIKTIFFNSQELSLAIENLKNGQPVDLSSISQPGIDEMDEEPELTDEQARKLFNAPPPAQTVTEALEQRRAKFQSTLEKEQAANNTSKVKMMTRLVKQYDQAIKASKLGKEFDYDSLPVPPGFGELPNSTSKRPPTKPTTEQPKQQSSATPAPPTVPARTKAPFKRTISVNNKQLDYLLQVSTSHIASC